MKTIEVKDIKDIENIKNLLEKDDFINISLGENNEFIAISAKEFETLESVKELIEESKMYEDDLDANGKIVNNVKIISKDGPINDNLSVEQYEFIKKQINLALEKTFKPKPEKLN